MKALLSQADEVHRYSSWESIKPPAISGRPNAEVSDPTKEGSLH